MPAAEAPSSGAYADLPGVKLWFTDSGGAGVPIVLLHPNTGTVEIWQPQIAAFATAGYRVIAFDRKGWGKSLADPASGPQPGGIAGRVSSERRHGAVRRLEVEIGMSRHRIEVDVAADEPRAKKGDRISVLPNHWWLFDDAAAKAAP